MENNPKIEIEMVVAKDIAIAPLIKDQARWPETDSRFRSFCADIKERGVQEPIRIDENNVLWDGYDRLRAAKRAKFTHIPVLRCKSEDGPDIAFGSFVQRKHATKSQRVYSAYPYFLARHEAAKNRALAVKQAGGKPADTAASESVEAMALEIGVSRDLFFQAAKLHETFASSPDLRAEFEPRIMDDEDPISLGGALAGIAGKGATAAKPKPANKGGKLGLFRDAFKGLKNRVKYWDRFEDEEKDAAVNAVKLAVFSMPAELRGEIRRAIAQAEKQERQQAVEAAA